MEDRFQSVNKLFAFLNHTRQARPFVIFVRYSPTKTATFTHKISSSISYLYRRISLRSTNGFQYISPGRIRSVRPVSSDDEIFLRVSLFWKVLLSGQAISFSLREGYLLHYLSLFQSPSAPSNRIYHVARIHYSRLKRLSEPCVADAHRKSVLQLVSVRLVFEYLRVIR